MHEQRFHIILHVEFGRQKKNKIFRFLLREGGIEVEKNRGKCACRKYSTTWQAREHCSVHVELDGSTERFKIMMDHDFEHCTVLILVT